MKAGAVPGIPHNLLDEAYATLSCGLRGKYKTIGGRRVKPDEYPWLARIIYTEKVPPRSVRFKKCSGVQISQRHVMTAMHCVVHYDERGNLRKMDPSGFSIYFGSYCGQHRECRNPHSAANTTGKKWKGNALDVAGDLAIIELRDDCEFNYSLSPHPNT
ncbi:hypothetical protein ANCDUO_22348 [Ancylostoma duodenale]|uniref:Peptidase S1 domain-containing protein n=1 Tax=Ancylostoma duodenale TaxID=51022 RepID=A0A0C2FLE7_9BILA|nr:hypothetical protein ANCDUO_22348 [Ancylostoma duodenale]